MCQDICAAGELTLLPDDSGPLLDSGFCFSAAAGWGGGRPRVSWERVQSCDRNFCWENIFQTPLLSVDEEKQEMDTSKHLPGYRLVWGSDKPFGVFELFI